jgi:hypothetical protein
LAKLSASLNWLSDRAGLPGAAANRCGGIDPVSFADGPFPLFRFLEFEVHSGIIAELVNVRQQSPDAML